MSMIEHNLDIQTSGVWVRGSCSCGGFNRTLLTATKRRNNSSLEEKIRRQHSGHVQEAILPIQVRVRRVRAHCVRRRSRVKK